MKNVKPINQIVPAFELWRHNRGSRKSPIPQRVRQQPAYIENISSSHVSTLLRITGQSSFTPEQHPMGELAAIGLEFISRLI